MSKTIIGLSFGNTSSSVAIMKDGVLEVIANQDGDRAIPTMLSYAHGDEYYGAQAKQQLVRNPKNTVAFFRDFLANSYAKIDVSANHRSAHPVEDSEKLVAFKVVDGESEHTVSVNEIVVRYLKQLHTAANDYIGKEIDGSVIAVPTNFSEQQRKLVAELAEKAGLPALQVINEPTAALLAHVSRPDIDAHANKLFVVADFGGTRSDGAVIAYNGGIFTILATMHDLELGGRDLDEAIIEHLAKEFEKEYKVDPRKEERAMAKLAHEAELIKKTLSNSTTTQFGIESVASGFDFSGSLNRLRFEMVGRSAFTRIGDFVKHLVAKANVDVLDVDEVLLVGGTSWVPKVSSVVSGLFDSERTVIRSPNTDTKAIDPDELIARGAAIQASLVSNFDAEEIAESLQPVVTNGPHLAKPIGVKTAEGVTEILAINTLIPIRKTISIPAEGDVLIEIVEIEREIKVETVKPEPKAAGEDEESDWSDDEDEEYEVRSRVVKPGKTLAQLGITANGKADIVVTISKDLKMQVAARSGSEHVAGTV
ncbi:Ribosome-associated complex subunit SSZ1 [Wickerhamiella sorbophila]|uniref:Ribosome-associated complex subunit SSZ1 n=1 Tax=Wickerhamiella sorbophila TaxID=45607 RepID=A0A2T0FJU0_9ASCO|nr:Ribosome-associated complex subunit SSZ1 [Wickerhamiella sorbophila]PRT55263.1 Ribosome-associated complex subunit SSZ1 [Wickerhamiella sorbophila]